MKPVTTPIELLRAIQRRRALYFGNSEHPFTSLVAFLSGFSIGRGVPHDETPWWKWDLVPSEFHDFVAHRFPKPCVGASGWETQIRGNTASEAEAFELFFQLREDFERESVAQKAGAAAGKHAPRVSAKAPRRRAKKRATP